MNADGTNPELLAFVGFAPEWLAARNAPPDCSVLTASPDELFPANRRFTTVTISGASDPDGDLTTVEIVSVTQDEPVRGPGDPTRPDARRTESPASIDLRAERSPRGDGRVYRVWVRASDGFSGGTCTAELKVSVPRHRKDRAIESPDSYDSFSRAAR
jgi:hypothetical protein